MFKNTFAKKENNQAINVTEGSVSSAKLRDK